MHAQVQFHAKINCLVTEILLPSLMSPRHILRRLRQPKEPYVVLFLSSAALEERLSLV